MQKPLRRENFGAVNFFPVLIMCYAAGAASVGFENFAEDANDFPNEAGKTAAVANVGAVFVLGVGCG